jgi:hypothetical protein
VDLYFVDEHLFDGENADESAARAVVFEADLARDLGEERVVLAEPDVQAGLEAAATLARRRAAASCCRGRYESFPGLSYVP